MQRIMKKLSTANPSLTYPERQSLLAQFVPTDLTSDTEISAFIEKSGDHIEAFVQSVRDAHVSDNILSWA
jgi:acetyl-CoA carboxylase/biotin carboxylase 1